MAISVLITMFNVLFWPGVVKQIYHQEDRFVVDEKGLIVWSIFFTLAIAVNGIGILIFPNVWSTMLVVFILLANPEYGTYVGHILAEDEMFQDLRNAKNWEERNRGVSYLVYLTFHFSALYILLFLVACLSMGNFSNMVVLGAIIQPVLYVLHVLFVYVLKIHSQPVREALGTSITEEVVKDLKSFYPEGVNTDRIKFLLHDTLKQEVPINLRFGIYGTITKLLRIFPGVLNIADDEGNVPFQLACQYSSVEVVKHMVELDNDLLNILDSKGNTVMHYACRGNNYKVINYLLTRHMQLVTKRNIEGDLPVYVLSSCTHHLIHGKVNGVPVYSNYGRSELDNPQHLETIWKLLLANPEDMQEKKLPSTQCTAVAEGSDLSATSLKPQKHHKLLVYVILVVLNMTAAVYIGSLQSLSNTNQMKYRSEVKRLVDELVASQNEMNMLRSRMEALKYLQAASE